MANIRLHPQSTGHRISRFIDGQFIEHLGRCIYDGIWVGEDSPIANEGGIRLDTAEALRKLEVPVVRWPGGLWADSYHWRDGIGPRGKRPVRQNIGWNTLESNQFGTHEFMRFCEMIGAEPYLCCNLGSGTVEEARSWAEYCNCDKDTTLARERAANGHPEPFDVKFWGLGNEAGYPLDGMMAPRYYADRARQFAGYVKYFAGQATLGNDPGFGRIKTALAITNSAGLEPFADAVEHGGAWSCLDLLSLHFYTSIAKPTPVEEFYAFIADLDRLEKELDIFCDWARKLSTEGHSVDVAVDEWGLWRAEAQPHTGLAQKYPMADALYAAVCLHMFHRYDKVYMGNLAQTQNVLQALVHTDGEKFCVTPTYHVFDLLKPHRSGTRIEARVDAAPAVALTEEKERDALSVSATTSDGGRELFLSAVNIDAENDVCCDLHIAGANWEVAESRLLQADDLYAENTFDEPARVAAKNAGITASPENPAVLFPAQSVTTLSIHIK